MTTMEERFWAKVDKNGPIPEHRPELGPCWVWTAGKNRGGYGHFWLNNHNCMAHRAAWEMTNGPLPKGVLVLHHCDNPSCVRPAHLFTGSNAVNRADCGAKGRIPRGEANGNAKLTEEEAHAIRAEYAAGGTTQIALARKYGVSSMPIHQIIQGLTWEAGAPIGPPTTEDGAALVTVYYAARELGLSYHTLRHQITNGKLNAIRLRGRWLVTADEIARYARDHRGKRQPIAAPPPASREEA